MFVSLTAILAHIHTDVFTPVPPLQPTMPSWGKKEKNEQVGKKGKWVKKISKNQKTLKSGKRRFYTNSRKKILIQTKAVHACNTLLSGLFFPDLFYGMKLHCLHHHLGQFQEEYKEASSEILSMYTKFHIYTDIWLRL